MKKVMRAGFSALKPWLPLLAILGPAAVGFALIVNGVLILAGAGWAYIASGLCLVGIAAVVRRGIYHVG